MVYVVSWPRPDSAVILFDGVCNFCNAWVNFVIDRDQRGEFCFATQQSPGGQAFLRGVFARRVDLRARGALVPERRRHMTMLPPGDEGVPAKQGPFT
jgi:predicted DCC family thiol-disulfide oxidoreductase YuxK